MYSFPLPSQKLAGQLCYLPITFPRPWLVCLLRWYTESRTTSESGYGFGASVCRIGFSTSVNYASVCSDDSANTDAGSASLSTGLLFGVLLCTRASPSCNDAPSFWLTSAIYKMHSRYYNQQFLNNKIPVSAQCSFMNAKLHPRVSVKSTANPSCPNIFMTD